MIQIDAKALEAAKNILLTRFNQDEWYIRNAARLCVEAYLAALTDSAPTPAPEEVWRHKKRGTTYTIVGNGELQMSEDVVDGSELVIYRSREDGRLWARPIDEFHDGRFELIAASQQGGDKP